MTQRLRVALVPDVRGWAYDNIAGQIRQRLSSGRYEFTVVYESDYAGRMDALFLELCSGRHDIAHVFSRPAAGALITPQTAAGVQQATGWSMADLIDRVLATRLTTSIYSHIRLDPVSLEEDRPLFAGGLFGYVVPTVELEAIYRGIDGYPRPAARIPDGVDLQLFRPRHLERLWTPGRELAIGWAGNSQWGYSRDGRDHKGLTSLIKPVVAALRAEGLPVRGVFHDRNDGWVPYTEMVEYFNSIDIYVCASATEATATPVLEAMACGVPVVSTRVGLVPEMFGPRQTAFIVERRRASIAAALRRLIAEPDTRRALSAENLERIKDFDWAVRVAGWDAFFTACAAQRPEDHRIGARRRVLEGALQADVRHVPPSWQRRWVWSRLRPLLSRRPRGRRVIGWLSRWNRWRANAVARLRGHVPERR